MSLLIAVQSFDEHCNMSDAHFVNLALKLVDILRPLQ